MSNTHSLSKCPQQPLSIKEQKDLIEELKNTYYTAIREDPRLPDVWLKANEEVISVEDMSLNHMCMTIGLWLRKEFEKKERIDLGLLILGPEEYPLVSAYGHIEDWLTQSQAMLNTPALSTMYARIQNLEGGLELLYETLQDRAQKSLENVHKDGDMNTIKPAFF